MSTVAGGESESGKVDWRSQGGILLAALAVLVGAFFFWPGGEGPDDWEREFPNTDFAQRSIEFDEIDSDGATRDSIPPIVDPRFIPAASAADVGPLEPVLSIGINGDHRAYPLRILLWHEIVNDVVGGVPVLVSYCPLCNSGVVFDRRAGDEVLEFGNTGRLRNFDMVMYDKATESWWQQFLGEALMGELTGTRLEALPARLESMQSFRKRAPEGRVLVPNDVRARPYGTTPYVGMDSGAEPPGIARLKAALPSGVRPLMRVIVVGEEAWTLDLVRDRGRIESGDLAIDWTPGQNSIHDTRQISDGRDVGNVVVRRRVDQGFEDVPYDVSFAFAFAAFVPDGTLHWER
ncbi:MAG: DUF3179 domain-containing protein [Alphaproteobacteria bacterium]